MDNSAAVGLYIHTPFCRSRCVYCDFFSTTCGATERRRFVDALCREMAVRRTSAQLGTIYLGGGTPTTLAADELEQVFRAIDANYDRSAVEEVTIEANPDDVTPEVCRHLVGQGINRVSLGVQTFDDNVLTLLRRRHNARAACRAVEMLCAAGITNISVDLIYGLPGQSLDMWRRDLATALSLPITHLSAYALMYSAGTVLTQWRDMGRIVEADEQLSLDMFQHLVDATAAAGFEHYEISNFARPGYRSRHNSAYWHGRPYIGLGPGAHSYDGLDLRRENLPDLEAYCCATGDVPHADEVLSRAEHMDEQIFTALRTADGLELTAFEKRYGSRALRVLLDAARPHLAQGTLVQHAGKLRLTRTGIFTSDNIMSDLMVGEDVLE